VSVSSPAKEASTLKQIKGRSIEDLVVAAVFVFTIFIIGTASLVRCFTSNAALSEPENRTVNGFPAIGLSASQLKAFPPGFDHFYNDRVLGRIELVSYLALLQYKMFNVSQNSSSLPGKHGWMYFLGQGGLETLRKAPLFSNEELTAWTEMLEERRKWLADRQIKFLLVFAPAKTSIYPEFLPAQFNTVAQQSRLDQLIAHLKQHSQIETLDLRQPLIESKKLGEVYFKTDGHWNRLGSFVGYKNMAIKLHEWFPTIQPLELADLTPTPNCTHEGDQAKLMGLNHFIVDRYTEYLPKNGFSWRTSNKPFVGDLKTPQDFLKPFASEVANSKLPKAYFLRDSFMSLPQVFLSEHFRRAYFDWQPTYDFPAAIVESEQPDVLVQEMVENHLFLLPPNPPELKLLSSNKP
jgi:hypothetical protein